MRNPVSKREATPSQSSRCAIRSERTRHDVLTADVNAARARVLALTWERAELLRRQFTMARQFDRRRAVSLQMIADLLAMQSRAMTALEAALQLNAAADCVIAYAQAHDRLDVIDARHGGEDRIRPDGVAGRIIGAMSAASDVRNGEILSERRPRSRSVVSCISRERQEASS
jgi:two-component sensor histidine kinase